VRQRGLGTQQVERLLNERLPHLRVVRMDVDTTTGKWAHADILARVEQQEVDVLLGTQMIAKGLDFPNVTLVGVVDADIGMNVPDFRAAERTFQLLAQVAGRAGRSTKAGHVIIQSRMASHHAIRYALTHDFIAFAAQELAGRLSPPYPPTVRLTNIVVSGSDEPTVMEEAQRASAWCTRVITRRELSGLKVIGPAKCAVERIKQRWRWHLLLRGGSSRDQSALLHYFARRFLPTSHSRKGLRVVIDRDPVSLL
jgi:primosomal protein N' (replication factor Y)